MSVAVGILGETASDAALCAKIAKHETLLQDGVIKLLDGVSVRLDFRYRLVVRISVLAEFGHDFVQLGRHVQDSVYRGIERASDLQVSAIHVRIAGVKPTNGSVPRMMFESSSVSSTAEAPMEFTKEAVS